MVIFMSLEQDHIIGLILIFLKTYYSSEYFSYF